MKLHFVNCVNCELSLRIYIVYDVDDDDHDSAKGDNLCVRNIFLEKGNF